MVHLINKIDPKYTCCGKTIQGENCVKLLAKTDCTKCKNAHNSFGFYDNSEEPKVEKDPLKKKCNKCEVDRGLTAFEKDGRAKDGRKSICKKCLKPKSLFELHAEGNFEEINKREAEIRGEPHKTEPELDILQLCKRNLKERDKEVRELRKQNNFLIQELKLEKSRRLSREELIDIDTALDIQTTSLVYSIEENVETIRKFSEEINEYKRQLDDIDKLSIKLRELEEQLKKDTNV